MGGGYVGLVWDIENKKEYTGKFLCTSYGLMFGQKSKIRALMGRFGFISPEITICTSPVTRFSKIYGPYGVYLGTSIN